MARRRQTTLTVDGRRIRIVSTVRTWMGQINAYQVEVGEVTHADLPADLASGSYHEIRRPGCMSRDQAENVAYSKWVQSHIPAPTAD